MTEIPQSHIDLIGAPHLAHLATTNKDGSPQNSPIWLKLDGDQIVFSTTEERRKTKNMRRTPSISLSIVDSDNPFRYIELRGPVTFEPDLEKTLPLELWPLYVGEGQYPIETDHETRVIVRFTPSHIVAQG
ncbi:MAG TPA: PPOX class F420-dependent oxidoreductase [Dehalococcoidia bacterium]|nr:PPOX class F420-dependent oxidoreductase [Dehalococcoidia bacterium]